MNPWMKSVSGTRGSVSTLYACMVLPLLFIGFTLTVDLANYYGETNDAQRALDEAAMHAYRSLPYQKEAAAAARSYLAYRAPARFGRQGEVAQIHTSGGTISLQYRAELELFFPRLFLLLAGAAPQAKVPITAFSRARGSPFHVFIAMDASGRYLAPRLAGPSWESEGKREAALFFSQHPLYHASGAVDPLVATQQCFNRPFSALKRAAISAYEYYSNFDTDQTGVGIYPISGMVGVARRVGPPTARIGPANGGEARFLDYNGVVNRDAYCMAAAEEEVAEPQYRVPPASMRLVEPARDPGAPAGHVIPPTFNYNHDYVPYERVRDVVWSAAAREEDPLPFPVVLRTVATELLSVANAKHNPAAAKIGLIFAGDLPWLEGVRWGAGTLQDAMLRTELNRFKNEFTPLLQQQGVKLRIEYIVFEHEGIGPVASQIPALQEVFGEADPAQAMSMRVFYLQSPELMLHQLLPLLLLNRRTSMIGR